MEKQQAQWESRPGAGRSTVEQFMNIAQSAEDLPATLRLWKDPGAPHNRSNALYHLGTVPRYNLIGPAWRRYWAMSRFCPVD
jgi:hypothetical protein